ncbi:hypothetical protein F8M41_004432 [Gigaspora margarita]|uniref:Uncharacterized protein n=1 Tax=Gigaspora margarita TaxID=4874 RepID=A0A8H4AXR3_GIGMA|nr:hypothetical protein F8M41_004432 [Gigaspora margarita]
MSPHKSRRRRTRSDDQTPKEHLDKFYKEHIQFLNRERKRTEKFFNENGMSVENLEIKLRELDIIIKERIQFKEEIPRLQLTQLISSDWINKLYVKKGDFKNINQTV